MKPEPAITGIKETWSGTASSENRTNEAMERRIRPGVNPHSGDLGTAQT
jgi:hypothetical protein